MTNNPQTLDEAHTIMFQRYINIIQNSVSSTMNLEEEDINQLINLAKLAIKEQLPLDKKARWLGYIQGVLASARVINIKEERDFSRPLFTQFYTNPQSYEV